MNQRKFVKIMGIILIGLILICIAAFFYVKQVASGSNPSSVPQGYETISANGLTFSVKTSGDKEGIPVILLHGFPESSAMWFPFMKELNGRGYYAIAPDQRGYSAGARPKETEAYALEHLGKDITALADALGIDQFHLVGHDWGSGVGWQVAATEPDRLISYTSLSVPHITAFARAYLEDTAQYKASGYIRDIQNPILPEYFLLKNDCEMIKQGWKDHGEEAAAAYYEVFSQKGAMTGALNWYRANYPTFRDGSEMGPVSVPTLFIWGNEDFALQRSGAEMTKEYVTGDYRFLEVNAGHWLIQKAYDEVSAEIMKHMAKYDSLQMITQP